VLLLTTYDAWLADPIRVGAWAPDDDSVLAVADEAFTSGQVVVVTLDPAPSRVPLPAVFSREQVSAVRFLRRGPDGAHTAVLDRPAVAQTLDLLPHPEGGWYRETWKTPVRFAPDGYPGERAAATGIYFLLPPGEESMWHVVRSDEVWLWHRGGPLTLLFGGTGPEPAVERQLTLGPGVEHGQHPQVVIPAGTWQAARPTGPEEVLVSCVVSPGFDFQDFRTRG
jgi:predicted cupin superfamily sugar epimerase